MENKDFDNIFSNKLSGLHEEDFTPKDGSWDKVEGILNDRKILPPQKKKWSGLVPIILLLLLSNFWLGWKYLSVDNDRTRLQTTITDLNQNLIDYKTKLEEATINSNSIIKSKSNKGNNTLLSDNQVTTVKTKIQVVEKIVEKIVERIIYIPRPVFTDLNDAGSLSIQLPSSFSVENGAEESNNDFSFNLKNGSNISNIPDDYGDTTAGNFYISEKWTNSLNFIDVEAESGNISENSADNSNNVTGSLLDNPLNFPDLGDNLFKVDDEIREDKVVMLDLLPLNPLKNKSEKLDSIKYTDDKKEDKVSLADHLTMIGYGFAPKSYEAGVNGSAAYGSSNQYYNRITTNVGIEGSIILHNQLRLNAQINYANMTYEVNDIWQNPYTDAWFAALPDLVGNDPADKVNRVKAYQHLVEVPIMIEYPLFSNKNWSPFIGFGVKARYHIAQKFEYEFVQAPQFTTVYGMPYVNTNFTEFGVNTIMGSLGADFYTRSNWILRIRLNYDNDFNSSGFDNKSYQDIGVGASIIYQFD